jgi:hypothetical protein
MANDPYMLLGVDRKTKFSEIKKKYFIMAKKYHPDLNPGNDVSIAFTIHILGDSMPIKCSFLLEMLTGKLNLITIHSFVKQEKRQLILMTQQLKLLIKSLSLGDLKTKDHILKILSKIFRVLDKVIKLMTGTRRNF